VQFGILGGHSGIGPPSGAGTLGAAAATVPTKTSIRITALNARFMGSLLDVRDFCGAVEAPQNSHGLALYRHRTSIKV
jgi:hypothetical protein